MLQEEWSWAGVCGWLVDGWVGVGRWSPASRAAGNHISPSWSPERYINFKVKVFWFFFVKGASPSCYDLVSFILGMVGLRESLQFLTCLCPTPFKKNPRLRFGWMELWHCDGASFVSMELNGSRGETTRREGQGNCDPPFCPQHWNSDLYSDHRPVETHVSLPKIDKWLTWRLKMVGREGCVFHESFILFFRA